MFQQQDMVFCGALVVIVILVFIVVLQKKHYAERMDSLKRAYKEKVERFRLQQVMTNTDHHNQIKEMHDNLWFQVTGMIKDASRMQPDAIKAIMEVSTGESKVFTEGYYSDPLVFALIRGEFIDSISRAQYMSENYQLPDNVSEIPSRVCVLTQKGKALAELLKLIQHH